MAGYQTIEALRPILHRGPVAAPVVDIRLVRGKSYKSNPRNKLTDAQIAEVAERRLAGESTMALGRAYGVSHFTIQRYTKHLPKPEGGWPQRRHRSKNIKTEFAKRLWRAGFTCAEIGEEVGCSSSRVHDIVVGAKRKKRSRIGIVVRAVADVTGVPHAQLRRLRTEGGGRVTPRTAKGRFILYWLARHKLGLSYEVVGTSLGGFNHTTIMHGVAQAEAAVAHFGIDREAVPGRIARRLWEADWRQIAKSAA